MRPCTTAQVIFQQPFRLHNSSSSIQHADFVFRLINPNKSIVCNDIVCNKPGLRTSLLLDSWVVNHDHFGWNLQPSLLPIVAATASILFLLQFLPHLVTAKHFCHYSTTHLTHQFYQCPQVPDKPMSLPSLQVDLNIHTTGNQPTHAPSCMAVCCPKQP